MEDDDVLILRVKDICCAPYRKELSKELSRLDGVQSFNIDADRSQVSVRGRVNANALLQTITETGKTAEIIHYPTRYTNNNDSSDYHHLDNSRRPQERPQNDNYQQHRNRGPDEHQQDMHHVPPRENYQQHMNRGPDESRFQQDTHQVPRRESYQQPMNHGYNPDESRNNRNTYQGPRNGNYQQQRSYSFEENHVCADYVPPMHGCLCRGCDHHGMDHNMRPIFPGNVPLGHVPYYAGLHNRPLYPPRVGPFGYGFGRPMRGFGNYGWYGHGIGRGYSRMM